MTTAFFIKTFLELVAIVLLAYGFLHEEQIAAWERKTWAKFRKNCHRRNIKIRRAIYNWLCKIEAQRSK